METLKVEVDDRLAVVTVNRPEVRNALSRQVLAELRDVLADLRERDDVGLVAFTGAGEKAFVAGADISQLRHYDLHTGLAAEMQRTFDIVEAFPNYPGIHNVAPGFQTGFLASRFTNGGHVVEVRAYTADGRVIPGWPQFAASMPGLYLTSSTAHPGGSVSGRPGRNAAQTLLAAPPT